MIRPIDSIYQSSTIKCSKFLSTSLFIGLFLLLSFSVKAQTQAPKEVQKQEAFTVEVYGSGSPFYLIPGLASGGEVWDKTVKRLKDRYECHVFTLAGFAGKEAIEQKPYLATIKKELTAYIEEKGPGVIMGHSLGGFLTLWMTSENRGLATKAVIVDSYPFLAALRQPGATEETVQFPREAMIQQMMQLDTAAYRQQQRSTLATMITNEEDIEMALQWSVNSDRATIINAMGDLMQTDLREVLKNIETPTLIMIAGKILVNGQRLYTEQQVQETAATQYQNHAQKTIKVANDAKHFIMMDDQQWFFETLENYLDEK